MAFTLHSHSGQFCPSHAKDSLEAIVQHAIAIGMTTIGLTEHMPRPHLFDLYPDELDDPHHHLAALAPRHTAYLAHATELQARYADQIDILIGFESEWIRRAHAPYILTLAADPRVAYFLGSVHHVLGVSIDFDAAHYGHAVATANAHAGAADPADVVTTLNLEVPPPYIADAPPWTADDECALYASYYAAQAEMLARVRPRVVAHFDVIRLFSKDPGRDMRAAAAAAAVSSSTSTSTSTSPNSSSPPNWASVWTQILHNLHTAHAAGALLECNTSALRKGLAEPYPARAIACAWRDLGGRFTLSDDSHSVAQLATNYARALDYLEELGVRRVWKLRRGRDGLDEVAVEIGEVRAALRE